MTLLLSRDTGFRTDRPSEHNAPRERGLGNKRQNKLDLHPARSQLSASARQLSRMPLCQGPICQAETLLILLVLVVKVDLCVKTINPLSLLRHSIELEIVRALFVLIRLSYLSHIYVSWIVKQTHGNNKHRHYPRRHHDEPEPLLRRTIMLAMTTRLVDAIDKTFAPIHPAALRFSAITVAGRIGQCCVVCDVFEEGS